MFKTAFAAGFGFTLGVMCAAFVPAVLLGVIDGATAADQAQPTGFGITAEMVEGAVPIATLERICDDRPATGLSFSR